MTVATEFEQIDSGMVLSNAILLYRGSSAADRHPYAAHLQQAPAFASIHPVEDAHATKIAIVFGGLDRPDGPSTAARLCAAGMFLPMTRSPFAGDPHAE